MCFFNTDCTLPASYGTYVNRGDCTGASLKDGQICTVSCNSTSSDPLDGASSYTYSCNDATGAGNLTVPQYTCYPSMSRLSYVVLGESFIGLLRGIIMCR